MRNGKWSRRDVLKVSAASAAGLMFAEPLRAAAPPPTAVTPALIEAARKEGKVAFYTALELPPPNGWRKFSRPGIPASPCASSAPARSGFSSASRRSRAAASRRWTSPTPPTPRIISTGRRTAGWRPTFPKMLQNISRPIRSIRRACTPPPAPGWRRSATTPIWSSARTRRRVTPTCLIRNG